MEIFHDSVSDDGARMRLHTNSERMTDIVRVKNPLKITCTRDSIEVEPDLVQLLS